MPSGVRSAVWLTVTAVASLIALVAASSAPAAPHVVDCALSAQSGMTQFDEDRDYVRGPFSLVTLARLMPRLSQASYLPRDGRLKGIKLPVGLRAGHTATLRIHPGQRRHAALLYGLQPTYTDHSVLAGDAAVTFKPCAADTAGPVTAWAGALNVTGPGCIRLQVLTDGARRRDIRLPLGRPCR